MFNDLLFCSLILYYDITFFFTYCFTAFAIYKYSAVKQQIKPEMN